jgi:hypothetical protein
MCDKSSFNKIYKSESFQKCYLSAHISFYHPLLAFEMSRIACLWRDSLLENWWLSMNLHSFIPIFYAYVTCSRLVLSRSHSFFCSLSFTRDWISKRFLSRFLLTLSFISLMTYVVMTFMTIDEDNMLLPITSNMT